MLIIVECDHKALDRYMSELHALRLYAWKGDFLVKYMALFCGRLFR